MSTRSQVDFYESKEKMEEFKPTARLYHHWDGYPSGRLPDIKKAVDMANEVYINTSGYEYRKDIGKGKDSYYMGDLAAFYVLAHKQGPGNVEIDNFLHSDIDYLYQVFPSTQGIKVRILETKSGFWDDTDIKNTNVVATNTLKTLLNKYKD